MYASQGWLSYRMCTGYIHFWWTVHRMWTYPDRLSQPILIFIYLRPLPTSLQSVDLKQLLLQNCRFLTESKIQIRHCHFSSNRRHCPRLQLSLEENYRSARGYRLGRGREYICRCRLHAHRHGREIRDGRCAFVVVDWIRVSGSP